MRNSSLESSLVKTFFIFNGQDNIALDYLPSMTISIPVSWVYDKELKPNDFHKLLRLHWAYEKVCILAKEKDENSDLSKVFYPTQENLCELLGFCQNSRAKVSGLLQRLEHLGYIERTKSSYTDLQGNKKPCFYLKIIYRSKK